MAYPTSLDSFSTKIDGVDYPKASHINSLQTAVEALEAKVGITDSTDPSSIDYAIKNSLWPIGSVFLSVVSTNPNTLMGFGTWTQIAGGKVLVGQTDADSDFNVAEETGGAKTVTIAQANLPNISTGAGTAHTHTQTAHTHYGVVYGGGANNSVYGMGDAGEAHYNENVSSTTATNQNESAHTHSLGGSGTALSILNPYLVVYIWKRTA